MVVVDRDSDFCNAVRNLPGIEIVHVDYLNAEMLAPGTHAGRLTIWMEKTIDLIDTKYPTKKKVTPPKKTTTTATKIATS